jgi:type VI secretion system protein ImpJ
MAKRPVHWFEGMFLKPHHFQASDLFHRERIRESEDWLHPHDWGLRSVRLDEDAIANYSVRLISCQARFKDGTMLSVPEEASVDPLELRAALGQKAEVMVYLAVPSWQESRANAERLRSEHNPRYLVAALERPDENTGADEEELEFRYIQARLVLEDPDLTGYELLPLARIVRTAAAGSPPRLDRTYVPPVLGVDAWPPLHDEVQALFRQIEAWINQEADQLVGRKVAFDSQVLGDAERILRLSALNTASATLQATLFTHGLHPLLMYQELCRLLGQLSIFGANRRPIKVPGYDHDDIGPIYWTVIGEIRRLIGDLVHIPFQKRYFKIEGRKLVVHLDADWTIETTRMYIGVETSELSDAECDALLGRGQSDWKLGSADEVEMIFKRAEEGLGMRPLNRIPPALPSGFVYFEIVRHPTYWKDVVRSQSLGLRFRVTGASAIGDQIIRLTDASTGRSYNLQFAVFAIPGR